MLYLTHRFRRASFVLALTSLLALIAPMRTANAQVPTSSASTAIPSGTLASQPTSACQPSWLPAFGGQPGTDYSVVALTVFDDGGGPALCAGGYFLGAGGVGAYRIAKWNGSSWSALGSGMNNYVLALTVFDDGGGPALYAGGSFTTAGGIAANHIAKWNGSIWSPLGSGMNNDVNALTVFDDGGGPALYAGGNFFSAGGVAVHGIAKWSGSSWSGLGNGMDHTVFALTVFDDGSGPALYAGGGFTIAGSVAANFIAKWNGSSWSALGSGMNNEVNALAVFDDGSGPALYAGAYFTIAGGVAANHIAKWNGSSWSPLGSGISSHVYALTAFDDGGGPALYAGGIFTTAGGVAARGIAKWNGSNWSGLGSGIGGVGGGPPFPHHPSVLALAAFDDGSGPALYAGGSFEVGPAGASYLAKWGNLPGCGMPGSSLCEPGVGGVSACPCGNAPVGGGLGCDNSSNTGGAQVSAIGIARLSFDTVVFTTNGERTAATSIVLQGDSVSPSGASFGQGVRCVAGSLKRMYVKVATGGSISAPQGTDLHVHARSVTLGDLIAPGTHRYYGVYYRDPIVLGGCAASSTFNITQQLDVLWSP